MVPGDVRSTLWLFETKPLDTLRDNVQVGHLQRVGPQEGEESSQMSVYPMLTPQHQPSLRVPREGWGEREM